MKYYCLTVRKCSNVKTVKSIDSTLEVYDTVIKYIKSLSETTHIEYHYEYTVPKQGQYNLHFHSMIKTDVPIYLKGKKGYTFKLEEVRSKAAWQAYITKHAYTKEDIKKLLTALMSGDTLITEKDLKEESISENSLDPVIPYNIFKRTNNL